MAAFAIIDDNTEQSDTLKIALVHYLELLGSSFTVMTQFPFENKTKYFDYVADNDICLLILDERLNDQRYKGCGPVNYKGNELVVFLRRRLKEFPIYAVTNFATDADLLDKFADYESIIRRSDIINEGNRYVPIFLRAAQRYLESNTKELEEFNVLTKMVARGKDNPKIIKKLAVLQTKLELPFSGFDDRTAWLNEYEKQLTELTKLKKEIHKRLKKKK